MSDSIKTTQTLSALGPGQDCFYGRDRSIHNMVVILGGSVAPTAAKVTLEGSLDNGVTHTVIATWDTADGRVSGDSVATSEAAWDRVRPNVVSWSGGTAPTAKCIIMSADE